MKNPVQCIVNPKEPYSPSQFLRIVHTTERGLHYKLYRSWSIAESPWDEIDIPEEFLASVYMESPTSVYALLEFSETEIAEIGFSSGSLTVSAYSDSLEKSQKIIDRIGELIPKVDCPNQVNVNFWSYGRNGPQSVLRSLDIRRWDEIENNYPAETYQRIMRVMSSDYRPSNDGRLILWHGEPGTGKTNAIRALIKEWRDWSTFHYITDPDKFFGEHSDYMMTVLLESSGAVKWRLLILEDAGELLQRDAKVTQGQALSRFLNSIDGLVGQGLRTMILVTTNDELSTWHPAVTRHGRIASEVEFRPFTPAEAEEWFRGKGEHDIQPTESLPLADLYAKLENREHKSEKKIAVGFA